MKLSKSTLLVVIWVLTLVVAACSPNSLPAEESNNTPTPELPRQEPQTAKGSFDKWWEDYKGPFHLDTSRYPAFYRGAWASRLDEARGYLLNEGKLREAGFDTILLGVDIVFDPETGDAKSLGDNVFIFYLQALKTAGFRIILIPNPMHPNLDMGQGYEWEGPDPNAHYHRSYELIKKLEPVVIKWAGIAEEYHVDGFAPVNEPYKLVRDYKDASRWLQEILPLIREVYSGEVIAVDTMYSQGLEPGLSIPFPYDYSGYDLILGGPPCGWSYIEDWEQMLNGYIQKGNEYVQAHNLKGFGLYEWGAYTGGVWCEPIPGDQVLSQGQAKLITEALVRQANGKVVASFPRVSMGWLDFDTPAFHVLSDWYRSMGVKVKPLDDKQWAYNELIEIERKLGSEDYEYIFQIEDSNSRILPGEEPAISVPDKFDLVTFVNSHEGGKVRISEDIQNHLYKDCEVRVAADDIRITDSKFVNCNVILEDASGVVFDRVIFRDLNQYEQAALSINNSQGITVNECQFVGNYIGLGIHGSSVNVTQCRFEGNNGHNALVVGEGSSAKVEGSYFYGSFPHAILIMNRENCSEAMVNISRNLIDQTGEDAIDFEDYRNAALSNVSNNLITNSGWAGLVVEYNSWAANITIENNWIEATGIDWKLPIHALQPDTFQTGWRHGILVEDSSKVYIRNNRIVSAGGNGIEIKNGRDIILQNNAISCLQVGIGVHGYKEGSLVRCFSPLAPEDADGSRVVAEGNIIYRAQQRWDVDKQSSVTR